MDIHIDELWENNGLLNNTKEFYSDFDYTAKQSLKKNSGG